MGNLLEKIKKIYKEDFEGDFKVLRDGAKKNPAMVLMTVLNLAVFAGICLKLKRASVFDREECTLWLMKK